MTENMELKDQIGQLTQEVRSFNEMKEKGIITTADFEAKSNAIGDRIDELEAKLNRPAVGTIMTAEEAEYREAKADVLGYMRQGTIPVESKAISTDKDTNGGAWLHPVVSNRIVEFAVEMTPMMRLAEIVTLPAGTTSYDQPREADDAMAVGWVGERESRTETATTTTGINLIPMNEMYALPKISQKALNNPGFNFERWLQGKVARKFALTAGTSSVSGNGVKQMQGFLNNADIAITTSGTSGTFDFDDLITVQYELFDTFGTNATWLMRRATARVARILKDGNGSYIWQTGGAMGQPDLLLGDKVEFAPDMPALTNSSKSIAYGDFKEGYTIIMGDRMKLLRDPYSSKPFIEFYFTQEIGGQVKNAQAIKILQMLA